MAGVKATETSSAMTVFGDVSEKWLNAVSAAATIWFGAGAIVAGNLVKDIFKAAKQKVKNLIGWLKNLWEKDKKKVLIGVGIGCLVIAGGVVVGGVIGGIGGIVTAIGGLGVVGTTIAGLALGGVLPSLVTGLLRTTTFLYNYNWQQSDKEINQQIEAALEGLYGVAGDALGVALAGMITGGAKGGLPKPQIRMGAIVSLWQTVEEDVQEEILQNLTNLAMAGVRTFGVILFKQIYMNARKFIKSKFRTGIPSIDKAIQSWGADGSKPWSMAMYVEEKIESIPDARIRAFTENFVESFFDSTGEFIELQWGR